MAFATYTDVETRLGRTLTDAQRDTATDVIALVTEQITDAVDRDSDWADGLSPVPATLKALCVGKAINALSRPEPAIAATSLGAYSVTYARETSADVFLSDAEERLVRMAVYGSLAASARTRGLADDVLEMADDGEINDSLEE